MKNSPINISIGFLFTLILLGACAIASNISLRKLTENRLSIQHTYKVIDALDHIRENLKDGERFRRGYLLTGNPIYLKEFDPNIAKIKEALQNFQELTINNPQQQKKVTELLPLIKLRINIWNESLVKLRQGSSLSSLSERINPQQIAMTERGKEVLDAIEKLLLSAEQTEYKLLEKRRNTVDLSVRNTTLISNFVYGLSLLSLILIYRLLLREISQRHYAQNLLDQTNINLTELVQEKTVILEKEQKRLIASQKIARIGSYEYDIVKDQLTWSEETFQIYHYDPNLPPPNNQVFLSHIHPEDLPECLEIFNKLCQQPLYFNIGYRFQCADGVLKYINARGESIIDQQGKISTIIGVVIDVTAQKKVEVKLREQAERLKLIVEGAEMATWDWYLPTNQLIWSRRHYEILGLTYPGYEEGDYATWVSLIHPEDRQQVLENYHNCLKKGEMYKHEYRIIRADNQAVKWLTAIGGFINDENGKTLRSIGVVFDITERKEAEIALQNAYETIAKSEQRYRSLIEATSQMVWQGRADGYLVYPTPGWHKITGQNTQEMLGFGWLNAVHPDDRSHVEEVISQTLQQIPPKKYECEYRLYQKSTNDYGYFLSRGIPVFDPQGKLEEWIGVTTDITATKLAEQILKDTNAILETKVTERTAELEKEIAERLEIEKQLREMTIDLERSNQELSQFAYIASHDLQEPLRAIMNFAQKISINYQGRLDAKADMYIEFVVDGANRMQNLVRDLLAYSRVGRKDLTWQTVNLNNLLIKVCHDLQIAIKETAAEIHIPPLPLLYGDHSQLSILWQNILSNSLKYHSNRPVNIEILLVNDTFPPTPDLSLESYTLLAIRDNGIGIDPKYNDRIFGIFQRLHTTEEYPGTGLGLAICQKIVERHHGKIWVESVLGEGTTFYLVLPKANCSDMAVLNTEI